MSCLQILEMLRSGEKCSCVLLEDLNISQSTLSYHMKILCDSGVVAGRVEGEWTHCGISEAGKNLLLAKPKALGRDSPTTGGESK